MSSRAPRSSSHGRTPEPPPQILPGRVAVGQIFEVGTTTATVVKWLAEGSFAHVYLAETVTGERVVLKRIVVPEEEALVTIMREIQVMKDVSFCDKIVQYIDASIEAMPSGGFEALLLMEYCPGGPVVDLMNTRLQTRFTEEEVLRIFGDACEAVASLHYQSPPLLHRDIKVENILVSAFGTYKLCDFGSATSETVAENAALNSRLVGEIEEDIERNTTLQYRAPEMIDLYQRLGLNEKVDIWALGILLYKLCFFGTPFDDGNKLAILNCRYQIPSQPTYSPDLVQLIRSMLQLSPSKRPNVYAVLSEVCRLRRVPCPIENIYVSSTSVARGTAAAQPSPETAVPPAPTLRPDSRASAQSNPSPRASDVSPSDAAFPQPPTNQQQSYRRGRPTGSKSNSKPLLGTPDSLMDQFVPKDVPSASVRSDLDGIFGTSPAPDAVPHHGTDFAFDAFGGGQPASANTFDAFEASFDFSAAPIAAVDPLQNPSPVAISTVAPQPVSVSPGMPSKSIDYMVSFAVANLATAEPVAKASNPPSLFDLLNNGSGPAAPAGTRPSSASPYIASTSDSRTAQEPKQRSPAEKDGPVSKSGPNLFDMLNQGAHAEAAASSRPPALPSRKPMLPPKPAALQSPPPKPARQEPRPAGDGKASVTARLQDLMGRLAVSAAPSQGGRTSPSKSPSKADSDRSSARSRTSMDSDTSSRDGRSRSPWRGSPQRFGFAGRWSPTKGSRADVQADEEANAGLWQDLGDEEHEEGGGRSSDDDGVLWQRS